LTLMVRAIDARNAFVAKGPVDFDALETQRKAEVG
jgi:hypothetical protein